MLFDRNNHVGKHRWTPRSRYGEHIRETWDGETKIGARTRRPLFLDRQAISSGDLYTQYRPCHRVKTGSKNQNIELKLIFLGG